MGLGHWWGVGTGLCSPRCFRHVAVIIGYNDQRKPMASNVISSLIGADLIANQYVGSSLVLSPLEGLFSSSKKTLNICELSYDLKSKSQIVKLPNQLAVSSNAFIIAA